MLLSSCIEARGKLFVAEKVLKPSLLVELDRLLVGFYCTVVEDLTTYNSSGTLVPRHGGARPQPDTCHR